MAKAALGPLFFWLSNPCQVFFLKQILVRFSACPHSPPNQSEGLMPALIHGPLAANNQVRRQAVADPLFFLQSSYDPRRCFLYGQDKLLM